MLCPSILCWDSRSPDSPRPISKPSYPTGRDVRGFKWDRYQAGMGRRVLVPWMPDDAALPALARYTRKRILVGVVKQIRLARHVELGVLFVVEPVLVQDRHGQLVAHGLELFVQEPV